MNSPELNNVLKLICDTQSADVLLYNGDLTRGADRKLIDLCARRERRKNVLLLLITDGGDPDAAYRISRCLQDHYKKFTCFVTGYCKSAGTLLAIGATELVISDHGELGPIDVQMSKKDELWEYQSGLTVIASLRSLHERAFSAVEHFFINTKRKSGGSISLKMATDIAAKLTQGLFTPLYAQIDPLHLGEAERATSIANEYGQRLNILSDNLKKSALVELIGAFPSHGFVIDRTEALSLFNHVREPNEAEQNLMKLLGDRAIIPTGQPDQPIVKYLDYIKQEDEPSESEAESDGNSEEAALNPPTEQ